MPEGLGETSSDEYGQWQATLTVYSRHLSCTTSRSTVGQAAADICGQASMDTSIFAFAIAGTSRRQ